MPATLQKLMRHKSIQTTLDYYAEVQSEAVGDELRRLAVPAKPLRATLRAKGHSEQIVDRSRISENLLFLKFF